MLIIAGVDGVFASGADIAQLRERRRDDALQGINSTIFVRIAKLPMPVIAALDGYCLGGGAELAYAADFRIGTPERADRQPRNRPGHPCRGRCQLAAEGAGGGAGGQGDPAGRAACCAPNEALAVNLITEIHEAPELMDAAHASPTGSPGRTRWPCGSPSPCSTPRPRPIPLIDQLAQGILFESQAKFDRMQAFLDKKTAKKQTRTDQSDGRSRHEQPAALPANLPPPTFPASSEFSAAAGWAPASPTPS